MKFLPRSFKNRLTLILGVFAVCIGLPVYLYLDHVYARQLVDDRGAALRDLANSTANGLAENLRERQREVELLAQTSLFRQANFADPELTRSIERLQKSYPHYSWIGFADHDGKVRAATQDLLLHADVSQRPWFHAGLQADYIGDLHSAVLLSKLLPQTTASQAPLRFIDFASPVRDASGQVRGVLAAHAHWRWATEVVRATVPANAKADGIDIFIVAQDNQLIYPEELADRVTVPRHLSAERPFGFDSWGSETMYMTARVAVRELSTVQPLGWQVMVRQPASVAMAPVRHLQRAILLGALVMVVVLLLMGRWVSRWFGQPLEQLVLRAQRIEQGDEDLNWNIKGRSNEVKLLVEALRRTTATLIRRKQALVDANADLEKKIAERTADLARVNEELKTLARRDPLTGTGNRFASMERLRGEFLRMKRVGQTYTVLALDIDHFKRVNDNHGHATGDAVLRDVAQTMRATVRDTDFVGRIGGEEFLVLLPNTPVSQAVLVADKIRQAVQAQHQPGVGQVTVSIGVASAELDDANEEQAVSLADAALYRAKKNGRNCVMPAEAPRDPAD